MWRRKSHGQICHTAIVEKWMLAILLTHNTSAEFMALVGYVIASLIWQHHRAVIHSIFRHRFLLERGVSDTPFPLLLKCMVHWNLAGGQNLLRTGIFPNKFSLNNCIDTCITVVSKYAKSALLYMIKTFFTMCRTVS